MFVEARNYDEQPLPYLVLQSKGDSPSLHGLETKNVFDEDLQKKIEENERLHIQVSPVYIRHCSVSKLYVPWKPSKLCLCFLLYTY